MEESNPNPHTVEYSTKEFSSIQEVRDFLDAENLFHLDGKELEDVSPEQLLNRLTLVGNGDGNAVPSQASGISYTDNAFSTPSCFLNGRWLFLSVIRKPEEEQHRQLEFNDFETKCQIQTCKVTRKTTSTWHQMQVAMHDFLESGGEQGVPDTIIVLGHGKKKEDRGGFVVTNEDVVSNQTMIEMVRDFLEQRPQRMCKTRLCLYFCHANEGATHTAHPHFRVAVYKKSKPMTLIDTGKPGQEARAYNTALRGLARHAQVLKAEAERASVDSPEKAQGDAVSETQEVESAPFRETAV